jgi:hypothetical protein
MKLFYSNVVFNCWDGRQGKWGMVIVVSIFGEWGLYVLIEVFI